ncbi:MAG: hypothetical protein ACFFA6_05815 [Promethearchaeota archaeon]
MDIIDNLKKIGEDWRLTVLLIWLLVGVAIIPYPNEIVSIIGILIFLPFLVFLMFLFLLTLISKKEIFEYPTWKIILFLLISLPIMLLISAILIILYAISIISYFFFTSWFILYGCYLLGKNIDTRLYKVPKARPLLRGIIFFGGLVGSILLLYLFIIGDTLFDFSVIMETYVQFPWYLKGVYIIVGGTLIGLAIVCIIYMFRKIFTGWFGIFSLLASIYTLYLVLKIYLGMIDTEPDKIGSIWAYLGIIIPDLLIIFYSLSTLMGSQAELLNKRIKRFGIDTVIIWLILSKVAYEFIHFFPYEVFEKANTPWINALKDIDNDLINLIKNFAVLIFFIALLVILGIYEIKKNVKEQRKIKEEVDEEVKELLSPKLFIEEYDKLEPRDNSEAIEDVKSINENIEDAHL